MDFEKYTFPPGVGEPNITQDNYTQAPRSNISFGANARPAALNVGIKWNDDLGPGLPNFIECGEPVKTSTRPVEAVKIIVTHFDK